MDRRGRVCGPPQRVNSPDSETDSETDSDSGSSGEARMVETGRLKGGAVTR